MSMVHKIRRYPRFSVRWQGVETEPNREQGGGQGTKMSSADKRRRLRAVSPPVEACPFQQRADRAQRQAVHVEIVAFQPGDEGRSVALRAVGSRLVERFAGRQIALDHRVVERAETHQGSD